MHIILISFVGPACVNSTVGFGIVYIDDLADRKCLWARHKCYAMLMYVCIYINREREYCIYIYTVFNWLYFIRISFAAVSWHRPARNLKCLRASEEATCLGAIGIHGQHTGDLSQAARSTGAISPWQSRGGEQVCWVVPVLVVRKIATNQARSDQSGTQFCRKVSKGHGDGLGRGRHRVNGGSRCGLCQISILGQGSLASKTDCFVSEEIGRNLDHTSQLWQVVPFAMWSISLGREHVHLCRILWILSIWAPIRHGKGCRRSFMSLEASSRGIASSRRANRSADLGDLCSCKGAAEAVQHGGRLCKLLARNQWIGAVNAGQIQKPPVIFQTGAVAPGRRKTSWQRAQLQDDRLAMRLKSCCRGVVGNMTSGRKMTAARLQDDRSKAPRWPQQGPPGAGHSSRPKLRRSQLRWRSWRWLRTIPWAHGA